MFPAPSPRAPSRRPNRAALTEERILTDHLSVKSIPPPGHAAGCSSLTGSRRTSSRRSWRRSSRPSAASSRTTPAATEARPAYAPPARHSLRPCRNPENPGGAALASDRSKTTGDADPGAPTTLDPRGAGLRAASEVLATVCILASLSRELTPVLAVLIVAVSTSATIFTRSCVAAFGKDVATQARLTEASGTAFANVRTVRSFSAEQGTLRGYAEIAGAARESGLGIGKVKSLLECANRGAISVSLFTLYAYGAPAPPLSPATPRAPPSARAACGLIRFMLLFWRCSPELSAGCLLFTLPPAGGWLCRQGIVPVGTMLASVGYTFFLIFGCTARTRPAAPSRPTHSGNCNGVPTARALAGAGTTPLSRGSVCPLLRGW